MKSKLICVLLLLSTLLSSCSKKDKPAGDSDTPSLGNDDASYGDELADLGALDGYFEDARSNVSVTCVTGTPNAYTLNDGILTFSGITEDSVYSISGELSGSITVNAGDFKLEIELCGFSLVSSEASPITVNSADKFTLKAKKGYKNYIYDTRPSISEDDEALHSGAVHSESDLEISGKGELAVVSSNNNGIHSKDDLEVKNLTLLVSCRDNALKGNDSVEISEGSLTLIATAGDGIKTTRSDISDKGKQRGTISISGGTHTVYAACDGIDASYNVMINNDATVLNIYTDKYSNYSEEITAADSDVYYIRFSSSYYKYSVKYYNSDEDIKWANAEYHSKVSGGRSTYYYYSFPKETEYEKIQFFIYSSDMESGQDENYLVCSDYMTPHSSYDTLALSQRESQLLYSWTNYTTTVQGGGFGGPGGMGGMDAGNTDKGDYSTKGIKAANEIILNSGTVSIKSYDDALHANNDGELENSQAPCGNVTVNGGDLSVYSNDDGIHADGVLCVNGGKISIAHSYEGIEGAYVKINSGDICVTASDDGINATASTGEAIAIYGGTVYVYCAGDGIDSNSTSSYSGIAFSGGRCVIISTSGGNSAIDSERGYSYSGGTVIAIMPRGGMVSEAVHCSDFSNVGKSTQMSLGAGEYLIAEIGDVTAAVKIPSAMSAYVIVLGDTSPKLNTKTNASIDVDERGVGWAD